MIKTSALVAWIAFLLLATTLGAPKLFAQSTDGETQKTTTAKPTVNSEQPATKKSEAKPKEQAKKGSKGKEDDKTFIPSEEISEDFAVSFPVDI